MIATDLRVGMKVWYLFMAPGDGMTHQEEVEVPDQLSLLAERVI